MAVDATMPSTGRLGDDNQCELQQHQQDGLDTTTGIADNFQTFLTLLTTQLQNQNPLDPLDTNQFTQQLVQFAGVEQQLKQNEQLKALIAHRKEQRSRPRRWSMSATRSRSTAASQQFNGSATWNLQGARRHHRQGHDHQRHRRNRL